jgi:signal peptidase I
VKKLKLPDLHWARHLIWISLLAGLFLYLNSSPPFQAVASNSMTPALSRGDLIFVSVAQPDLIKEGDIIIFKVSEVFQKKYGYSSSVCHRVVRIQTSQGELTFRTKGDAVSEDPFMVLSQDIIGMKSGSIPYLGYLIMFLQSSQGLVFLIGLVVLFLIYSNSNKIVTSARVMRFYLFGISPQEYFKSQQEMEQKINHMNYHVAQAMNSFAAAMADYARHLESHTSAVKSLAQVARHLESILPAGKEIVIKEVPHVEVISESIPVENQEVKQVKETRPEVLEAIEITPELREAVKEFIAGYLHTHHLRSLEMTSELREAVWEFINDYVKTHQNQTSGSEIPALPVK